MFILSKKTPLHAHVCTSTVCECVSVEGEKAWCPTVPPPRGLPCIHGSAPNSAAIHTPLEKIKGTQMCPVTADALTSPLNQQGPPCSQGSGGT